jgi:hypothetical protein
LQSGVQGLGSWFWVWGLELVLGLGFEGFEVVLGLGLEVGLPELRRSTLDPEPHPHTHSLTHSLTLSLSHSLEVGLPELLHDGQVFHRHRTVPMSE